MEYKMESAQSGHYSTELNNNNNNNLSEDIKTALKDMKNSDAFIDYEKISSTDFQSESHKGCPFFGPQGPIDHSVKNLFFFFRDFLQYFQGHYQ